VCLAIPGKVIEKARENDGLMGKVDFSGVSRKVCLDLVPEVSPGEYVLVHVGFALARIDAVEAARVFQVLEELRQLGDLEMPSA